MVRHLPIAACIGVAVVHASIAQSLPRYSIETVAGNGEAAFSGDGGAALEASIQIPGMIRFDSADNLYISDYKNNCGRKLTRLSANWLAF